MDMSKETFKKFIDDEFAGNHNKCAQGLGLAPSTVCRIVNGSSKPGIKAITNLVKYCKDKNINYEMYISLS